MKKTNKKPDKRNNPSQPSHIETTDRSGGILQAALKGRSAYTAEIGN